MFCFGAQPSGVAGAQAAADVSKSLFRNVDAANPNEDITPNGTQAYGQSETSVAALGSYVVEAWNDATGFFSPCPSQNNKEELTGFGFSNNGGKSFTDLGGVPNNCANDIADGDPSVEAWTYQGFKYFYITSLYNSPSGTGPSEIALTACQVEGSGSSAILACNQPIIAATSSDCAVSNSSTFCSFLDKDFASIDPVRGRLYISYTEFDLNGNSTINLAACDLTFNPMVPVCSNGSSAAPVAPYLVVAPVDANFCENEGAYPAVDIASGDVYVAYEHNWPSVLAAGACLTDPVKEIVTYIPHQCLTLPSASCSAPAAQAAELVSSLSAAFVPGYNRFPMNDFPRIAVSDTAGTVSIVWNDGRFKPSGNILLQSWRTGVNFPTPVQLEPVIVDDHTQKGWKILPALRNTDGEGNLNVSWYSRASATTAVTNVYGAVGVSPLTTATPPSVLITNTPSDWNAVSSDIVPNFGDYTDNYMSATAVLPYTSDTWNVAWSDGRLGDPQPFLGVERIYRLIVATAGSGSGAVSVSPLGTPCGAGCYIYVAGTKVTVMATANPGSLFTGWTGACSGTKACTVTMNATTTVTARFSIAYQLTVATTRSGSGTVAVSPVGISCGTGCYTYAARTSVTVTATANSGSLFTGWTGACTGMGGCTVTMNANTTVTAIFNIAYQLTVATAGSGNGTVSVSPTGIPCGTNCYVYLSGAVVTLTATVSSGSHFGGWTSTCSGTNPCTTVMNANTTVTADFRLLPNISVQQAGDGWKFHNQQAGDTNIVVIGWNDNTHMVKGVTDSAGNTYREGAPLITSSGGGGQVSQTIWYAENIKGYAGTNSITINFGGSSGWPNGPDVRVAEVSGLATSGSFDASGGAFVTPPCCTTVISSGTAQTQANNELIIGAVTTTGAAAVGPGFSVLFYNTWTGDLVEQETVLSTGNYAASAQCWGKCVIQMATFRAAVQ